MRLLPERRQHLRIMTLKNAAWLLAGLIILFLAFSTWNELRSGDPSRERLYQRGSDAATPAAVARGPLKTGEERPVVDQTFWIRGGADPLAPPPPSPPPTLPAATAERPRPVTLKEARQRGERIVITGGAEGVRVEGTRSPGTTTETAVPPDRF